VKKTQTKLLTPHFALKMEKINMKDSPKDEEDVEVCVQCDDLIAAVTQDNKSIEEVCEEK